MGSEQQPTSPPHPQPFGPPFPRPEQCLPTKDPSSHPWGSRDRCKMSRPSAMPPHQPPGKARLILSSPAHPRPLSQPPQELEDWDHTGGFAVPSRLSLVPCADPCLPERPCLSPARLSAWRRPPPPWQRVCHGVALFILSLTFVSLSTAAVSLPRLNPS